MAELQVSNIYKWYNQKIEELTEDLKLDREDICVSQLVYLKGKINELLDMLLLIIKHVDVINNEVKKEKN